jgi:predicted RNA-binding Zn ribbon-like protein
VAAKEAPGELELVRQFVNSKEVDEGIERLSSPAELQRWLSEHGLPSGSRLGAPDVERAVALREALRALLFANAGEGLDRRAVTTLNECAHAVRLGARFTDEGDAVLSSEQGGADAAFGRILAIVHRAMVEGRWNRLKACSDDTCQWAFYDASRNRSAHWCSMEVCGNRAKARAYRRRRSTKRP